METSRRPHTRDPSRVEGSAGGAIHLWALLLWIVFTACNVWWIVRDSQPPGNDQANHLMRSLEYASAFELVRPSRFARLWFAEYGPVGQYTYPPLYHILTGAVLCVVRQSAAAGILSNMAFLWVLLSSVVRLGYMAFGHLGIGVAAAALAAMYFCVAQMQHEAFIDFALTAMTAWCAWRLAATNRFQDRRASIGFGIVMGLGLLTKQTIVFFLVGPVLYMLVRMRWSRDTWTNVALAAAATLAVALPWYGLHVRALLNTFTFNRAWASVEGQPMPWTPYGAVFYLHTMAVFQTGLPLFLLALAAAAVWLFRGFRHPGTDSARDARGIIVTWAVIGLALFTFLLFYKEFRYTMPLLPAVALLTCSLAARMATRGARVACLALIVACALPYYVFVVFGLSPIDRNVGITVGGLRWDVWSNFNWYGAGPRREDWSIPDMLEEIRREHPGSEPSRLALVPHLLHLNVNTIKLLAIEHGVPLVVTTVGNSKPPGDLPMHDFVFLKTGLAGARYLTDRAVEIARFVADHPDTFRLVVRYPLPDRSVGTLYRVVAGTTGAVHSDS